MTEYDKMGTLEALEYMEVQIPDYQGGWTTVEVKATEEQKLQLLQVHKEVYEWAKEQARVDIAHKLQ